MSSSSRTLGQAQRELRATAWRAARDRLATVLLSEPMDQRQAQPARPVARREERLEDVGQIVGQNGVAGIRET
jgi:hypothetical protein